METMRIRCYYEGDDFLGGVARKIVELTRE